jgi:DNA-binding NarL/FixJ family response regulator
MPPQSLLKAGMPVSAFSDAHDRCIVDCFAEQVLGHQPEQTRESIQADGVRPAGQEKLSKRKREILEVIAKGLTNSDIAESLFKSVGTA